MKPAYILIPLLATTASVGYFFHWRSAQVTQHRASVLVVDEYAGRDGKKEAEADAAAGKLVILEYGLYLPWDAERREVALKKFGVEYRPLAGCMVTEPLTKYVAAYNGVMEPKIASRFGPDVFDTANREGLALLESRWSKREANSESSVSR
ncbi:MAG: hypothetical protein H7343_15885 [Undibacterium sp.]|nr:hypothetical protein [Opitutaceae bacterium]